MLSLKTMLMSILNWIKKNDDTGWITGTGTLGNPITYRRKNGYVFLQTNYGTKSLTKGQYVTVFTLPVGFRPTKGVHASTDGVGAPSRSIVGRIQASGEIQVYSSESSVYFNLSACFPLD